MEASYLVGSFPCQFNFKSVFDIPLGTGNLWTFLPFPVGCSQQISTVPTPDNGGNPGIKVLHMSTLHQVMVGTLESRFCSTVPTPSNGGNPGIKVSSHSPLSVSADC